MLFVFMCCAIVAFLSSVSLYTTVCLAASLFSVLDDFFCLLASQKKKGWREVGRTGGRQGGRKE